MACASCGGGRQLTPNRPAPSQQQLHQSPNKIVINPGSRSGGNQSVMKPNGQTKRTQV